MSSRLTQKILVPVDGSVLAKRIVKLVERLAPGGEVKFVQVATDTTVDLALEGKAVLGAAKTSLEALVKKFEAADIRASSALMVGDPAEEILKLAESWKPTLIAMSTHGRSGVERLVRGSVAERVLRDSRAPLLIANPFALNASDRSSRWKRILVPLDGSARSAEILPIVTEIASRSKAEVVLLQSTSAKAGGTAVDARRSHDEVRGALEAVGQELKGITWRVLTTGKAPVTAIKSAIESEKVDLVAMTSHGSGLSRAVFGSVTEAVARDCRCPLLVVRSFEDAGSKARKPR
jgi:nucleotide-binding universal stress UspA family protein